MINKIKNLAIKILHKSQKYTKTDNVYIAKESLNLMIGNIFSIITSILLSIVFARLLPKEIYGQYRYILSLMTVFAIFSLEGMNISLTQGVANNFGGTVREGLKEKLKWSLLGSITSIGFSIYFYTQENLAFTLSFLIIAIFLPFFKGGELYQSILDGKKMFKKRVFYATIIQILSTLLIILTLLITKNLVIIILVYFASYSFLRTMFYYLARKKADLNDINDAKTISFGKHFSIMKILNILSQQIDKILLFSFLGPTELAIYSFAILPIDHIRTPLQNIQEIALPKLSTRTNEEIKKNLPKKLVISFFIILSVIIIYFILAPYFYKLLYPQYMEAVRYSRLFALTLLIFPVSMITLSLCAKMKTKELYKFNTITDIIQIILIIILTPLYGIIGIIVSKLIVQTMATALSFYFLKKL